MTTSLYFDVAAQAMAGGWYPTEAFDEQGRPLWSVPGRDGLVPLEVFASMSEMREAA